MIVMRQVVQRQAMTATMMVESGQPENARAETRRLPIMACLHD